MKKRQQSYISPTKVARDVFPGCIVSFNKFPQKPLQILFWKQRIQSGLDPSQNSIQGGVCARKLRRERGNLGDFSLRDQYLKFFLGEEPNNYRIVSFNIAGQEDDQFGEKNQPKTGSAADVFEQLKTHLY